MYDDLQKAGWLEEIFYAFMFNTTLLGVLNE